MVNTTYDIIVPLSSGTIWHNNEVRYLIRSFVKNFPQLGKIFIVGFKPDFLKWTDPRLIHIPCDDPYRHNKDANIIYKVMKACARNDISDDFIRCSDDQLVIKPTTIDDFYPRYLNNIFNLNVVSNNRWKRRVLHTAEILRKEKKTTFHYECHYPMIYNKKSFLQIIGKYNVFDTNGYTINTLYFNNILDEHKQLGDIKLTIHRPILTMSDLLILLKNKTFVGYNNKGLREGVLKVWIESTFHQKTQFEL